jgi:integrase
MPSTQSGAAPLPRPAPDTGGKPMRRKSSSQGIVKKHARSCVSHGDDKRCNCTPTYQAWVWSSADHKKIYRSFSGKGALAAAKGWRTDATKGVRDKTMRAPLRLSLREAEDAWLAAAESGEIRSRNRQPFKPSTLRGYRHDVETYVYPDLGARRLADVGADDLQALVDRLLATGMSASKARNVIVPLQSLYRRHRRQVPLDPTDGLDLPESGGRRERAASPAEAARLLDALPEEDQALWATAFYGGLRRGELRALRDEDIDLTANVIHVRRGWDDVQGAIDPKSQKGARDVPLAAVLRRYLLEHRARTGRRGTDLFFGRTAFDPFTPTHIRKRARAAWAATVIGEFFAGRSAQLEPIGLHECRHTYVSLMHAAGIPLERIGDYVGHSSSYMTDRYRHLIEGQRDADAERFDALLALADGQS